MRFPAGLRALNHRDFRLFITGQLISLIGTWMQSVAQSWLVLELTNSPFKLGLIGTLQFGPMLCFSFIAGAIADRLPKRRVIIGTQTAVMCQAFTLALLAWLGHVQYWHVAILAGCYGLAASMPRTPPRRAVEVDPARALPAPREIALFLDVDGTLLHIADTPDAVTIDRATVDLLARANRATGGATALITGRRIADVDRLFAPLALPVAGQHGFERRDAAGALHRHAQPLPQLTAVRARLDAFAAAHPGVLIEDKVLTIVAHYRLAPGTAPALGTLVERLAAESGSALAIQRGKMVLELRPAGKDKGTAIAEFLDEAPFRGRTPVFLGDGAGIPSCLVKSGDLIKWCEASKKTEYYKRLAEEIEGKFLPNWLSLDKESMTGRVLNLPGKGDVEAKFNVKAVVEYYSR